MFDYHNVSFWITDGTLLGYYRENDFINHDHDMDIAVFIDDWKDEILVDLKRKEFKLLYIYGDKSCGLEYTLLKNNIRTDIFFFYKENNYYWHAAWDISKIKSFLNMIKYLYEPFKLKEIKFKNINLKIPENTEKYIIQKYGKNWKTPIKKWRWNYDPKNYKKTNIYYLK
mgnify:CR=1 FL=1